MTDELETVKRAANKVDQHRDNVEIARYHLNVAIRNASAAGRSLREIAAAARVSHQTIANIVNRSQP